MIVPSSAVDNMNLRGLAGITSLAMARETNLPDARPRPPASSTV
jgi:hypothetical protein